MIVVDVSFRMGNHDNICEKPKYLLEKYPQSQEEASLLGQPREEEIEDPLLD